jgi:hypothetical protein
MAASTPALPPELRCAGPGCDRRHASPFDALGEWWTCEGFASREAVLARFEQSGVLPRVLCYGCTYVMITRPRR